MDSDLKEKTKLENHDKNSACNSSRVASSQTQSLTFILYSSLSISFLIFLLPHQYVDGNLVPALIFTAHPYLFRALVIAVMLSFAGASSGLLIGNNYRHATIFRWYLRISQISLVLALLILAFALFLEIFRLVFSGFQLRVNEDGADSFFLYNYVFQVFRKIFPASEELPAVT